MLCLSGFELYSRWVPLISDRLYPVVKLIDLIISYHISAGAGILGGSVITYRSLGF